MHLTLPHLNLFFLSFPHLLNSGTDLDLPTKGRTVSQEKEDMTINNADNMTLNGDSGSCTRPVRRTRKRTQLNSSQVVWKNSWAYKWPDEQDVNWVYGWPTSEHNYQQLDAEDNYEEDKWTTGLASRRNSVSSDSATEENGKLPDYIVYNSVSSTPEHIYLIASRNSLSTTLP